MQILKEERAAVFNFLGMVRLVRNFTRTPDAAALVSFPFQKAATKCMAVIHHSGHELTDLVIPAYFTASWKSCCEQTP